jgi:hypothetical protein
MNTCTRCGDYFRPKYANSKLCYACWKQRERAFDLLDHYQAENAQLRDALAQHPAREPSIELQAAKAEIERLKTRISLLELMQSFKQSAPPAIPQDIARLLRVLVHPDKHANSPAATRAFQWVQQTLH